MNVSVLWPSPAVPTRGVSNSAGSPPPGLSRGGERNHGVTSRLDVAPVPAFWFTRELPVFSAANATHRPQRNVGVGEGGWHTGWKERERETEGGGEEGYMQGFMDYAVITNEAEGERTDRVTLVTCRLWPCLPPRHSGMISSLQLWTGDDGEHEGDGETTLDRLIRPRRSLCTSKSPHVVIRPTSALMEMKTDVCSRTCRTWSHHIGCHESARCASNMWTRSVLRWKNVHTSYSNADICYFTFYF